MDKEFKPTHGGVIHTYRRYDPQRFPMPDADAPDLVTPAFEHLLYYGSLQELTDEQLAEAIEIDPRQIRGLGPSLGALIAMLEARKRKILETYEVDTVRRDADRVYRDAAGRIEPPQNMRAAFETAVRDEIVTDLERLWYAVDQRGDFARGVVTLIGHLGNRYEIEELAAKYEFSGRKGLSIERALEVKEELETIDRLIEQLKQAAKDAKVYVINMDELARFIDEADLEDMGALQREVSELLRRMAEEQGIRQSDGKISLTPKAYKLFQTKLLNRIFSDLEAARSGRHNVEVSGDGAVELQRTKPYEFGDSLANMDMVASMTNAMIRNGPGLPVRMTPEDIEIHLTRNNPKCATVVCMDMSGSKRWGGQYVNVKRMALALHGLIRSEYPGDFVDFVEVCTLPKRRHISEIAELMPRPVTIYDPIVRLKADMSNEAVTEWNIHPHFTNIQQGLRLSRQMLQVQDTPNRRIILITDGLPTAHFEDKWLYMLYPPDPRTERFTLREGLLCREQGIIINIFLLSNWSQSHEDVQFANRLAESTAGRVFFVGGKELDRYVVWDYLERRRIIYG
ncbi:MAG: hypothetical protein O7D94_13080 [Planctomycetota bacterium]|nr:hypothetical protein [Planctomycetota bacterium]